MKIMNLKKKKKGKEKASNINSGGGDNTGPWGLEYLSCLGKRKIRP